MSEVLQANIFFLITGIAVIVFTFLLCIALYHLIRILKSFRRIMDRIEAGSEVIAEDMQHIRAFFTEEGFLARLIQSVMGDRTRPQRSSAPRAAQPTKKAERPARTELKIKGEE